MVEVGSEDDKVPQVANEGQQNTQVAESLGVPH